MRDALPYGTRPWPQTFWDARAATNFVCGGLGAGLVVATVASGAQGPARVLPLLLGLGIVACGLASVFAELGRPLRAANVVRNPRTSWMTREALVAPLLFAAGSSPRRAASPSRSSRRCSRCSSSTARAGWCRRRAASPRGVRRSRRG